MKSIRIIASFGCSIASRVQRRNNAAALVPLVNDGVRCISSITTDGGQPAFHGDSFADKKPQDGLAHMDFHKQQGKRDEIIRPDDQWENEFMNKVSQVKYDKDRAANDEIIKQNSNTTATIGYCSVKGPIGDW